MRVTLHLVSRLSNILDEPNARPLVLEARRRPADGEEERICSVGYTNSAIIQTGPRCLIGNMDYPMSCAGLNVPTRRMNVNV